MKLLFLPALAGIFLALTGSAGAATFSVVPNADAFVATGPTGNLSGDNFGGAGALGLSAPGLPQGEFQSVLRFDLSGAFNSFNSLYGAGQWTIQSVTLQLTSSPHNNAIFNNIAAGQFGISLMQNNSWIEGTGTGGIPTTDGISFNSLQSTYINSLTDQALGTFNFPGGSSGANTYSLGLSSGLLADIEDGGDLSLRLFAADSSVSYLFSSRAVSGGPAPDLIITVVPEPASLALGALGVGVFLLWRIVRC